VRLGAGGPTIADVSTGIGDTLRIAREDQGRTLEDAARTLRVRTDYLRALEDERFDAFGGDIYAKGFLRNYATELGVDPQPLLDTYRREIGRDDVHAVPVLGTVTAPKPGRATPPPWIAWLLVAVVILAVLAFIGGALGGRSPDVAVDEPAGPPPSPAPTAPTDEEEAAEEGEPEAEAEPEPEEEPEEEMAPDGVELLLALEESSWLQVTIDGTVAFEQTVPAGETIPFEGSNEVVIRYGNAGGVRVQFNGEDLGAPGGRGQVVTVSYTPEGPDPA
jgi:cytoskeleton protein RodZ